MPRRKLCVLEHHDFDEWSRDWTAGEAAARLPYGLEALDDRYELWQPSEPTRPAARKVVDKVTYHWDREVAWVPRGLAGLRSSDLCLTMFEDFGLTYSALHRRVLQLPPVLVMTCWMSERLLTFAHKQRVHFGRLADMAAAMTVFSANQVPLLHSRIGVPAAKVHVLDYGVLTDFYAPDPSLGEGDYHVAIGRDVGRDWDTFFAAAGRCPELRFKVAAEPVIMAAHDVPPNVELLGTLTNAGYRDLLRGARSSVVCVHPLAYPSGQSVLLESAACGRPTVATRTPALRRYHDAVGALTFEPGDAEGLACTMRALDATAGRRAELGAAAREAAVAHFDARTMWSDVAAILDSIG